ncbi:MAG: HEAT repeat domain-containing protein [Myxococcales bacterium]|nr:HEAT repeat domain-containing protein [Myxococcales bacterium]
MSLYLLGCASGATKQSVSLYESGDYRGARAAAERGLATAPDDEDASRMHVRAQLALGDGAEVARSYHRHKLARAGNDDAALVLELAEATLGQGLRSPSTALRLASIRAVEESELRGLADAVAERMTDPDDRVVATAAAAVLRGYPDAVEALDDMLRSEDEEARRIALDGLGRKVAKHARAELTAGAADPDPSVRRTALRHLASLRDPSHAALFQQRARDRDAGVRAAALHGLAALDVPRLGAQTRAELAPVLAAALRDPALPARLAAVALAAALGARAALEPLLVDPDLTVALGAARALGASEAVAGQVVARGLASSRWTDRAATLNQLGAVLGAAAPARARAPGRSSARGAARRGAGARLFWGPGRAGRGGGRGGGGRRAALVLAGRGR